MAALAGRRPSASTAPSVESRLLSLPLREKVAQLFVFEVNGTAMTEAYAERLRATKPGGVIFVGANISAAADLAAFVRAIHETNPDLPPLVAVDQEGGLVTRVPGDPAPDPATMGRLPAGEARAAAEARAVFLRGFGFDVNLAPVADVAYTPDSFMAGRSYGADPEAVARTVAAVVAGQNRTRIVGSAKHFPGHGRTPLDSHLALPELDLSLDEWRETDAEPFRAAIAAGVPSVMLDHLQRVPGGERVHPQVVGDDDAGEAELAAWDPLEVVDRALDAGVDLLLYVRPPLADEELIGHVVARVARGELPEARIDRSLRRLARVHRR
jgi:beta-N-acetylhexosaminidase